MKIYSVGGELFHADVRTDRQTVMTKLLLAFRKFLRTRENWTYFHEHIFLEDKGAICSNGPVMRYTSVIKRLES